MMHQIHISTNSLQSLYSLHSLGIGELHPKKVLYMYSLGGRSGLIAYLEGTLSDTVHNNGGNNFSIYYFIEEWKITNVLLHIN